MTNKLDKDHPVTSETRREIPTAPPSIKLFGRRKPFRPKPAERMPRESMKKSRPSLLIWICKDLIPFPCEKVRAGDLSAWIDEIFVQMPEPRTFFQSGCIGF
jgi:hypothetical protein